MQSCAISLANYFAELELFVFAICITSGGYGGTEMCYFIQFAALLLLVSAFKKMFQTLKTRVDLRVAPHESMLNNSVFKRHQIDPATACVAFSRHCCNCCGNTPCSRHQALHADSSSAAVLITDSSRAAAVHTRCVAGLSSA